MLEGRPVDEACRLALREAGEPAVPHILRALRANPDAYGLVVSLAAPLAEAAVQTLTEVCRRTTSSLLVRPAAELVANSPGDRLRRLASAIRPRRSESLEAACEK